MKKILILLIAFTFLASCGNKEENNETETGILDTEINTGVDSNIQVENTESGQIINVDGDIKVDNGNNPSTTVKNGKEVNVENHTSNNTTATADEEALENEVNDLLDEFIDSLDNYDK